MLLLCLKCAFANNYYFSTSTGNNAYNSTQAQNPNTPWQTLDKLDSFFTNLQPGDSVFFKRGDVFNGSIQVTKSGAAGSPIVFTAYGQGSQPVISGFTMLTQWAAGTNGIQYAPCAACGATLNMVVIDGVEKAEGRYPNKGYLYFESHSGTTSITDNQLPSSPNWTGAEAVIRTRRWILDRDSIKSHSGHTINYSSASNTVPYDNYGYFIQNSLQTLDSLGEWYYQPAQKQLNVFWGSANPANSNVQVTAIKNLVNINAQKYITFQNISLTGANENAFYINNAGTIAITNCNITLSGINAIMAMATAGLKIEQDTINQSNNNGFDGEYGITGASIQKNLIKNTGKIAGMGNSGIGFYTAIAVNGSNNTVIDNEIDSSGYEGISFIGDTTLIKNNFINYFALTKDDGGGIYTFGVTNTGKQRNIVGNIISNGIGAPNGTDNTTYKAASGIYMDANSNGVNIDSNTVSTCALSGVFIHDAQQINILGNILYNNGSQLLMAEDNTGAAIKNNVIKNNLLFANTSDQWVIKAFTIFANDLGQYGLFDSNYYCRPLGTDFYIYTSYVQSGAYNIVYYDLTGWKLTYGADMASKKFSSAVTTYTIDSLVGGNKYSNGNFDANINGVIGSANCGLAWDNSQVTLNGGSVKITRDTTSAPSNHSYAIINIGAVSASKNYILKLSAMGMDSNAVVSFYLRESYSPYKIISTIYKKRIGTARADYQFLVTPVMDTSAACIVMEIENKCQSFWVDNFSVMEAKITQADPKTLTKYAYNATLALKKYTPGSYYLDVKSKNTSTR
jgi:hypothetical protein